MSTAFLYSDLDSVEVISLPPTTLSETGDRLYLELHKALYGLRRAPLACYKTPKRALVEMGPQSTSEPTLFRSDRRYPFGIRGRFVVGWRQ